MSNKQHFVNEEYEEKIGKSFGDYYYTKKALRNNTDGRIRVIYGNRIINVD